MLECDELIAKIKEYNPDSNAEFIRKAYEYSKKMHEGQTRSSGEPYYTHTVEAAEILTELKLDDASIATALLHDTVEDTEATDEDISELFGEDVARLVRGVTKLGQIKSQTFAGKQAENFRKLVLAISEDIRVLLVKLADRTHNMRTLHHFKRPEKRRRIALETLEIYCALAARVGVHRLKEELEDQAFTYLNPEARESITTRLTFLRGEGEDQINTIISQISKDLKDAGIDAEITGREKTPFSIWKKMQHKNVSFEQLSDIMAFRIVASDIGQCYHVLGTIHGKYPNIPGRFKDYISTPKPNGYRSIHTTVVGPGGHRIEVQIRTPEMHEEADFGVAAHWAYKDSGGKSTLKDARQFRWMRELLDILEEAEKPEEFLENTKLELFQDMTYAFSPKGDLIELPSGATPVDFAYAIHSGIGDTCVGAKINGRIVPLNTKIHNGDQVEIHTSKSQTPSPTWERFVVTGKARSRIRRYIRLQQRDQYVELGKAMLKKIFRQESYELTDKLVNSVAKKFKGENADDVYVRIGSGNVVAREVFKAIFPSHKSQEDNDKRLHNPFEKAAHSINKTIRGKSAPMPIKGLVPGMAVHYARCCHPLPGDRIVGIVTTGRGVTIHTIDCETLESFADTPERWVDVSWGDESEAQESHVGRLNLTINHEPGALGTLSNVISKNDGNITNLKINNRTPDFWDMHVDVQVKDTAHLKNIVAALRATPEITSVNRSRKR